MKIERRHFFKTTTAAFALALTSQGKGLGHASQKKGELRASSGTLYLEGELKSGVLKMEAQNFFDRKDLSVIVRSTLESTVQGKLESIELYSAMFSYQDDLSVFALFHDHDHSTIVVLSDTDNGSTGGAVVWNDGESPQILSFDKDKIVKADNPQTVADLKGTSPNWIGGRKPPDFKLAELEKVFGSNPELLAFMRGKKANHRRLSGAEWRCWLLSNVPGSTLGNGWR